jgi:hypothetical protein
MSKPTRDSVPWVDVVEAGKKVGIELEEMSLDEAKVLFTDTVEATPPEKENDLDPLVVDVFNNMVIFKVPVTGHPDAGDGVLEVGAAAPPEESAVPTGEGVVEAPLPETTKGKNAAEKAAAKAAKEKEKADKKAAKEAEKAAKKAAKAEKKESKKGTREKSEGYAAVIRSGILAGDPEGVVIQRAFEAYKAKGIPADKDEAWALARAKRTYHYMRAELAKQGRVEPKPKPVKESKQEEPGAPPPGEPATGEAAPEAAAE